MFVEKFKIQVSVCYNVCFHLLTALAFNAIERVTKFREVRNVCEQSKILVEKWNEKIPEKHFSQVVFQ